MPDGFDLGAAVDAELARRGVGAASSDGGMPAPAQSAPPPPSGFNPLDAIDAELARRGVDPAKATADLTVQQQRGSGSRTADGHLTGPVANLGAGANDAITGLLGAPVDAATWLLNQGGPTSPGLGIEHPVGGSEWWRKVFGYGGANPEDVVASDGLDRLARGTGAGAANMALPFGVAKAIPEAATAAPGVLNGVVGTFRHGSLASNAAIGAAGGAAGAAASENVPDEWKPLADFAGNLVGGGAVGLAGAGSRALVEGGSRLLDSTTAPFTEAGRERLAGARLRNAASDPGAVSLALADHADAGSPELVPGSAPTTYQLTGDAGLGRLERVQAAGHSDAFMARIADQAAARSDAVDALAPEGSRAAAASDHLAAVGRGVQEIADRAVTGARGAADNAVAALAPEGARPGAVRDLLSARLAELDDLNDRLAQAGRQRVASAVDALGGALPRDQYGADIRDELSGARQAVKTRESALWQAIDPDGTLALDATPVRRAANEIVKSMPDSARPMEGEERAIFGLAQTQPGVQKFSELTALRGRLLGAIREERFQNGETPALRRMTQLRSAIDDAIGNAATGDQAAGAAPVASGLGTAAPASSPSLGTRVYTPSGRPVDVKYDVVDMARPGTLVTSHDADLNVNPAFPAELQPRQRERAASELQVQSIAGNLQPERLGASASAADGAPIVGPDGVVESGNARVLGLARAYRQNGPAAQSYRDFLHSQGYDTSGMSAPVLVRRRVTDLSPEDRIRFTQEANAPPGLAMSATERAAVDAQRLPADVLDLYRSGAVGSTENRDFVRAFMRAVPEKGEEGAFATPDGALSVEGTQRIRNALLHKAYGDANLVGALAETGDENIRAFGNALSDAAGDVARLRSQVAAGRVRPEMDISGPLLEAARNVRDARARGVPIADAVAQSDAFAGRSPLVEDLLHTAYGDDLRGRISRYRMADALRFFAEEAGKQSTDARLFGDTVSAGDILGLARARYGGGPGRTETGNAAGAGDVAGTGAGLGPGAGAGRQEAPGHGNGAPGPAAAGGSGRGGAGILPEAPLSANFDADAAARYRAAADATRERKQTFDNGPVGQALRSGPNGAPYAVADSQVAAKFFNGGPRAHEDVQAFMAAAGGRDQAVGLLKDYAASSLRAAAERPDGTLDLRAYERWMDRHADALRSFPDLAERFGSAAAAQRTMDEAVSSARDVADAYRRSAARHFLGADPEHAVAAALRSRDPAQTMRSLVRMTSTDADAQAGLRRAVADAIGAQPAGKRAAFVEANRPALAELFGPAELRAVSHSEEALARVSEGAQATVDAFQKSAARHFIGNDPVVAVGRALNSANPSRDFAQLARLVSGNPDARAGLQRAVADFVGAKLFSNTEAGATGATMLKAAAFQSFVKKNAGALGWVMTPEQIDSMRAIAADLQRANRSIAGTKLPGGSNTTQDTVARGKLGNGKESLLTRLTELSVGSGAGFLLGGPVGGYLGGVGSTVFNALRGARLSQVDDLVTQAMLHPELARTLLAKVGPERPDPLILQQLSAQLRALAATSAVSSVRKQR